MSKYREIRGSLQGERCEHKSWADLCEKCEIDRLHAEIERLRAALRGMINNACAACDEDYVIRATKKEWDAHVNATAKARAALEEKQ